MANLKGKTLFITGASRGIGKAIALKAARDGANIVVAAKTSEPDPRLPGTDHQLLQENLMRFGFGTKTNIQLPYEWGGRLPSDEEKRKLVEAGVVEITLLGQTVNHYHFDHSAEVTINGLVQPQIGRAVTPGLRV